MTQRPSAAQALYGHLPSAARAERPERKGSVGDAMWPQLSREAKARERDQALWDAINRRQRESFVRGLREANASLDKRERER
jgi:hypothetical protein